MAPLFRSAGVPDGVVQIIPGEGPQIGSVMVEHPEVRCVSLTGSKATGSKLMAGAASQIKRVSLELGGNAPFIILPDADLDFTVDQLVQLKLFVTGQVCVTANRIFVPDVLHEQVIDRLISKLESSKVEDGLNDSSQNRVDAGPLIHSQACVGVDALVDEACKSGAKVAYRYAFGRGDRSKGEGSFYAPTVLSNVVDDMRISKGEIFGPVFAIHTYRTVDEVIQRANSVSQGLAGYVYGTDLSDCRRVARKLDVGIVGVNEWRPLKAEIPFGGIKESGIGSEGGIEGLSEYLRLRVISLPKD
jgi:succinate-semialdehyde dehydrogenase/glutarate-semialdehyde dehydrogenase